MFQPLFKIESKREYIFMSKEEWKNFTSIDDMKVWNKRFKKYNQKYGYMIKDLSGEYYMSKVPYRSCKDRIEVDNRFIDQIKKEYGIDLSQNCIF